MTFGQASPTVRLRQQGGFRAQDSKTPDRGLPLVGRSCCDVIAVQIMAIA